MKKISTSSRKEKKLWKRNLLKNASFRVEQNLLKKMKNGSKRKKLNFSKKLLFGVFIGKQIKRKMKFFQTILGFNKNLSFFQLFRMSELKKILLIEKQYLKNQHSASKSLTKMLLGGTLWFKNHALKGISQFWKR